MINTIKYLNSNSEIPDEIICVIPFEKFIDNEYFSNQNIKIIKTNYFGQVQQRIEGFKHASNKFVLQLDDDILISIEDVKILMKHLTSLSINSAIGPQFFDNYRKKFYYKQIEGWQFFESSIIDFFFGGAKFGYSRMGTVSKIGKNYGVDIEKMNNSIQKVEWLAGGCVLHNRKNLILENYYPYSGKAYCEDVIHSILLSKKGIDLWICKESVCSLSDQPQILNNIESNKVKQIQLYIIKLINGNRILFEINYRYWSIRNYILNYISK